MVRVIGDGSQRTIIVIVLSFGGREFVIGMRAVAVESSMFCGRFLFREQFERVLNEISVRLIQ